MTPRFRRRACLVALGGFAAFVLWGLAGLPNFGAYHGPYGFIVSGITEPQTHATGVVSAVNFYFRGFDTLGEEFILFAAAVGVASVLRELRRSQPGSARQAAARTEVLRTSAGIRLLGLCLVGFLFVLGWWLTAHAQTDPSGGFQGGVVAVSGVIMVYLSGQYVTFRRVSPVALTDALESFGAGGFALVGLGTLAAGAYFLADVMPLGTSPGAVDSSGTIVTISCVVGIEVMAAFALIVSELLDQTFLVGGGAT